MSKAKVYKSKVILQMVTGLGVGGFVGGLVAGLLEHGDLRTGLLYGLIAFLSIPAAEILCCSVQNHIFKGLTFGAGAGILVSVLAYFILSREENFFRFAFPLFAATFIGGSLYAFVITHIQIRTGRRP